jgi:RNA polymerase sigma factor (sigma-70 family)
VSAAPGLWTKHRNVAHAIAREFYVAGYERQDLKQEADIVLWECARTFDPQRGVTFSHYAGSCIRRRLISLLRVSACNNRRALNESVRDVQLELVSGGDATVRQVVLNERVREAVRAVEALTATERAAIVARIMGAESSRDKRMDNALQRARHKLEASLGVAA